MQSRGMTEPGRAGPSRVGPATGGETGFERGQGMSGELDKRREVSSGDGGACWGRWRRRLGERRRGKSGAGAPAHCYGRRGYMRRGYMRRSHTTDRPAQHYIGLAVKQGWSAGSYTHNSFIECSIEAGILLSGNGTLRLMASKASRVVQTVAAQEGAAQAWGRCGGAGGRYRIMSHFEQRSIETDLFSFMDSS